MQFLIGSWAYNTKMRGVWRPGIELFEQPSGRAPDAENLHNLSEGYYEAIVEKSDERTVRRMVDNEHVLPLAGTPVYPEFRDLVHTRKVDLDPRCRCASASTAACRRSTRRRRSASAAWPGSCASRPRSRRARHRRRALRRADQPRARQADVRAVGQ
jgi:hypothetical protein